MAAVKGRVAPLTCGIVAGVELVGSCCMGTTGGLSFDILTGAGESRGKDIQIRVGDSGKSNIGWAGGLGGGTIIPR